MQGAMADYTIKHYIDDICFEDYGVHVSSTTGLLDQPKYKSGLSTDWAEQHGKVVDVSGRRFDERTITLSCWAVLHDGMYENTKTLQDFLALFQGDGLHQLRIDIDPEHPLVYMVYCSDEIALTKKFRDDPMTVTFSLKLKEMQPLKKVYYCDGDSITFGKDGSSVMNIYGVGGNQLLDWTGSARYYDMDTESGKVDKDIIEQIPLETTVSTTPTVNETTAVDISARDYNSSAQYDVTSSSLSRETIGEMVNNETNTDCVHTSVIDSSVIEWYALGKTVTKTRRSTYTISNGSSSTTGDVLMTFTPTTSSSSDYSRTVIEGDFTGYYVPTPAYSGVQLQHNTTYWSGGSNWTNATFSTTGDDARCWWATSSNGTTKSCSWTAPVYSQLRFISILVDRSGNDTTSGNPNVSWANVKYHFESDYEDIDYTSGTKYSTQSVSSGTKMAENIYAYGSPWRKEDVDIPAFVINSSAGFYVQLQPYCHLRLRVWGGTNDGSTATIYVRRSSATGTSVGSKSISSAVSSSVAPQSFVVDVDNDSSSVVNYYVVGSANVLLYYLTSEQYDLPQSASASYGVAGTTESTQNILTAQSSSSSFNFPQVVPAFSTVELTVNTNISGYFNVVDATHYDFMSSTSSGGDECVLHQSIANSTYTWTFDNDTGEDMSYRCEVIKNSNSYVYSIVANIITKEVAIIAEDYLANRRELAENFFVCGEKLYRVGDDHYAIHFDEENGFYFIVPAQKATVLTLYLSKDDNSGEDAKVLILKDSFNGEETASFDVSTFVNSDSAGSEKHYVQLANTSEEDVYYYIHTASGSARLFYANLSVFPLLDSTQSWRSEAGEMYSLNLLSTNPFNIPPLSSVTIYGVFDTNLNQFYVYDKTHNLTEPECYIIESSPSGEVSWTFENDTLETVAYEYELHEGDSGAGTEPTAANPLVAEITPTNIYIDSRLYLDSGDTIGDLTVFGDNVYRSDSEFTSATFDEASGFTFTVPRATVSRINLCLSTDGEGETKLVQISKDYSTGEVVEEAEISSFVSATNTPSQFESFTLTNDTSAGVKYFIHTAEGKARLLYYSRENFENIDSTEQSYVVTNTSEETLTLIDSVEELSIGCLREFTKKVPAFSRITITGVFSSNESNGSFVLQDKTHNYEEPECNYLINELVGTGTFEWQIDNDTAEEILYAYGSLNEEILCDSLTVRIEKCSLGISTNYYLPIGTSLTKNISIYGSRVHRAETEHTALVIGEDSGFRIYLPARKMMRLNMFLSTDSSGESVKYTIRKDDGDNGAIVAEGEVSTFVDSNDSESEAHVVELYNDTTSSYTETRDYSISGVTVLSSEVTAESEAQVTIEKDGYIYAPTDGASFTGVYTLASGYSEGWCKFYYEVSINSEVVYTSSDYTFDVTPSSGQSIDIKIPYANDMNDVGVKAGDIFAFRLIYSSEGVGGGRITLSDYNFSVVTTLVGDDQYFYLGTESDKARSLVLTYEIYDPNQNLETTSTTTTTTVLRGTTSTLPSGDDYTLTIPAFTVATITGEFVQNSGTFFVRDITHHPTESESGYLIKEDLTSSEYTWTIENLRNYSIVVSYGSIDGEAICNSLRADLARKTIQEVERLDSTLYGKGYYVVTGDIDSENVTSTGTEIWSRLL